MTGFNLVIALVIYALLSSPLVYKRSLVIRLSTITYAFIVASLVYFSFETYKGWPTTEDPIKGKLVSVHIVDPRGRTPGAIYYWVTGDRDLSALEELYTYEPDELESPPRAHYVPYSKKTADMFREAQQALEDGMTVQIESMGDPNEESASGKTGDGKPGKNEGNTGDSEDYNVPHFKILEPSQGLEKQQ